MGFGGPVQLKKSRRSLLVRPVPDMVQFAMDLTDLIIARYKEMKQYPQYAENVPHWIDRAERKLKMLLEFVNRQNELADAGEVSEVPRGIAKWRKSSN